MKHFYFLLITTFSCSSLFLSGQTLAPIKIERKVAQRLGFVAEPVSEHTVEDDIIGTAKIIYDPTKTYSVSSFFAGQVDRDLVQIGDQVSKGQDLVRLRSREVAEVIATYIEASSRFDSASLLYEREKELRAKQLTTQEAYLAAKVAYRESMASRTASLQIALLTRSREELTLMAAGDGATDMTHLNIKSALTGTVIKKAKYAGESVETNKEIFKIADMSSLLVDIQVPLQATTMIKLGDQLTFHTVVGKLRTGVVTVSKISPSINSNSLSLRVLATLANAKNDWLVGTPLNVNIVDSRAQKVTAIPTSAIVQIAGKAHVFKVNDSANYVPIPVTLGKRSQDFAEVTEGIQKGDMIIVKGATLLRAAWEEGASQ